MGIIAEMVGKYFIFLGSILVVSNAETPPGIVHNCMPCKKVATGPLAGIYYLQSDMEERCSDFCSYVRDNDIYCFEPGQEVVETCNEEIPNPGTGMETKPTPGMVPATFMPPATNMPINPSEVKCGMRRTGTDCLKGSVKTRETATLFPIMVTLRLELAR